MKYYEVKFTLSPFSSDASDLLAALAGENGFETFEETTDGLTGYIQQQLFDQPALDAMLESFPISDITIRYTTHEAEDRDWNEQWEQEGFAPIMVGHQLVIHDGRHLPTEPAKVEIEIDAHLAFGTGTHETTRMVCATLTETSMKGLRVLDCGCGTGILGIAAMKLGARECVSYDIDEWSVNNTRHNAVINQVEVTPLLGDATILNNVEGDFDLIMANINRNILIADLPMFRKKMASKARLILSGFYTEDVAMLTTKAAELGLCLTAQREDHQWACMVLQLMH
ncbi:MAG: 50S ribosomal protein L11 methyltransferase [Prevotella sp.]|nr:50S ribosomal protein L11 methyltransferase [Prevotella sp.]